MGNHQSNKDSIGVRIAVIGAFAMVATAIIAGVFDLLPRPSSTPIPLPPSSVPPTSTVPTATSTLCQFQVGGVAQGPGLGNRGFVSAAASQVFLGFMGGNRSKYPWDKEKLNGVVAVATAKGNPIDNGEIETHLQGEDWYFYGIPVEEVLMLYAYNKTDSRTPWVAITRRDDGIFEYRLWNSDEIRQLNECSEDDIHIMGNPLVQVSIFNPSDDLPNRIYYRYFVAGGSGP